MRCRVGDLAFTLSEDKNDKDAGRLVHVMRLAMQGEIIGGIELDNPHKYVCWVVSPATDIPMEWGGELVSILVWADEFLRPIRDNPGTDEVIERVGYPCVLEPAC